MDWKQLLNDILVVLGVLFVFTITGIFARLDTPDTLLNPELENLGLELLLTPLLGLSILLLIGLLLVLLLISVMLIKHSISYRNRRKIRERYS